VDNLVAMTGEVSIRGLVMPVGGVVAKVDAALQAGAKKVLIPAENYQKIFETMKEIEVLTVERLEEVLDQALTLGPALDSASGFSRQAELFAAKGIGSSLGCNKSQGIALEKN